MKSMIGHKCSNLNKDTKLSIKKTRTINEQGRQSQFVQPPIVPFAVHVQVDLVHGRKHLEVGGALRDELLGRLCQPHVHGLHLRKDLQIRVSYGNVISCSSASET